MIDTEVLRLRNLRGVALRARAFAKALDGPKIESDIYAKSVLTCWTVARIVTGRLRGHPYLRYQKGPSNFSHVADRITAALVTFGARRRGRGASLYAQELQRLIRAVDDARALTLSADLSDALGRSQIQLRRLHLDIVSRATHESGRFAKVAAQNTTRLQEIAVESPWPYLAL